MNWILHRNNAFKVFFFFIFFIVFAAKAFSQDSTRTVSGKLLDENGKPVVGATLIVQDSSAGATTIEDGSFFFETGLTPPFKIYISATGYAPYIIDYAGSTTNLNVTL